MLQIMLAPSSRQVPTKALLLSLLQPTAFQNKYKLMRQCTFSVLLLDSRWCQSSALMHNIPQQAVC